MTVNSDIKDRLIGHQIGLLRLSNATIRKTLALLRRVDADIVARLAREDLSQLRARELNRLLSDVRAIIDSAYEDATGALRIDLEALGDYEGQYQYDLFRSVLPDDVPFYRASGDQIIAAVNSRPFQGRILKGWLDELAPDAFARVRDIIRMGVVEGRTLTEIARDIAGTRANGYKDGVGEINRRQASTVARTAVNHVATTARERFYKRNADLIRGVEWVSVLDGRTTLICMARDGKIWEVDKGPRPPAHPNCRSTTAPVLKSASQIAAGDIKRLDGKPGEEMNYNDWLRKQPASFQDDVLGKSKGQLFRAGELPVDKFVDRKGREYTLDELKRREAEAWQKAFA